MSDATLQLATPSLAPPRATPPRLGFLGTGWIGRHRMQAIAADGCATVAAIADASPDAAAQAADAVPGACVVGSLDALLDLELDGLVIATPSALHAPQAIAALERGCAVFCQKPLARTAAESRRVVDAARAADRLLGVDLSYRHTAGARAVRDLVREGALGAVYAVDLVFHNAYGPDKAWFRDPALAGGGCVIDLGIHLVDLALWTLGWPAVRRVDGRLYAQGRALADPARQVEDHAVATLELATGATVRLACSWHLSAGQDAVIEAAFYGTEGGAALRNVDGSFYDFVAQRFRGTARATLAEPPDAWGGRAAVAWARALASGARFDPDVERIVEVAAALDGIYGRAEVGP
ncbi:Gfo/Idh/MocA family protein [Roseisolibacter agri]|uniref:Oxidoreductase n=1 Tax=Roseisolibacter agri TaxID=2014610 RepID=A0AA37QCP6_9BACT|nr:Gfo/Idh/MocA family oxidoreductase [Roseisolibacter agri]GLC24303.1 oxidoreductase [Roseisolibacter agri]